MSSDRRKYPRLKFTLPIKISDTGGFDAVTETKNISGNGAYCALNKEIPLMTKLSIILLVPFRKNKRKLLKKINCSGVVVRKDYTRNNGNHFYNVGIYFNEIKDTDRKIITSYVNSNLSKVSS